MNYYTFVDKKEIAKEKSKVKAAKKSRWWQQKCMAGICHYCNQKFEISKLTMDHIVPLARGGKTTPGNVVPSCLSCNKDKGVDTVVDMIFKDKEDKSKEDKDKEDKI